MNTVEDYKNRITELQRELAESRQREEYYQNISKQAGRKRLIETRELSQLVSQYREAQEQLAADSEKLEELVKKRTKELEQTNQQLLNIIHEQKETRKKLERSVELDRVILEMSSAFINQPAHKVDRTIIKALEKIGYYSEASRVSLFILAEKSETILNTHDWKKNKTENHIDQFHDQFFPNYLEGLRQKKDIIISSPEDLFALTNGAAAEINKNKFHALLAVPLLKRGDIYGALFLYGACGRQQTWPQELVTFVKIISDVLVNALERKVAELAIRESEERYRDLVEKAGLAIALDAEDGTFHYFNQRFADLFGYTEKEISKMRMADLIHPEDIERVTAIHNNRFQNQEMPTRYEFRGVKKAGDTIYLEVDVVALKMKDQIIATRSYLWDVTHRVQSERAIQESEERYRTLVENFSDIVFITDMNCNPLYANPAFTTQTGLTLDMFDTVQDRLAMDSWQRDKAHAWIINFIKSDEHISKRIELRIKAKDGIPLYYSLMASKITYNDKAALQFIANNITEQKQAENALKKSADFEKTVSAVMSQFVGSEITDDKIVNALSVLAEWSHASRVTIFRFVEPGPFMRCAYEWCENSDLFEMDNRQNVAIDFFEEWREIYQKHGVIHIPDKSKLPDHLMRESALAGSKSAQAFLFLPFRVRDKMYGAIALEGKDFQNRWTDDDINLLRLAAEIFSSAFERIEAEKMLRRSEEQYRTLFESSNDEIYLHGFTEQMVPDVFINANQIACSRLGYSKEELLNKTVFDVDAQHVHGKIPYTSKEIFEHKNYIFETIHSTKNGHKYPVEVSAHLIEIEGRSVVMSIARDITERKRMEEEVQKSQRLESIGLLAGGIAHDFNNLLSIILGNAQLARVMSDQGKDISKFISNIEQGAGQAATLTRQLLTFSKGGAPILEVHPLPDLIRNAVQLALSGLDEQAVFDFAPDLYQANVDKGQINQVIHNLVLNSDQAMPNGGIIQVSAHNVHSNQVQQLRGLHPGDYVRIRIRDFGIGIKQSEQERVFDPYYTTKKEGNGLGLTVAYSIIKKHDGLLLLDSVPGEGTTVDIYLPAVHKTLETTRDSHPTFTSHSGRAFILDDEKLVLEMAEAMLKELNFEVKCSRHGEELLEQYKAAMRDGNVPDIVIMDLTIPAGMNGMEAMQELRRLHPGVKAIVSSGYSNDKIMSNYEQYGFSGVVAKPYTLEDLRRVIASVMEK